MRGELTVVTVHRICLSLAFLSVTWVVPGDMPPPSPRLCTHTGKSGRVALGTIQDTQEKQFVPFCFCLAGLSALGCLQGMRQADAEISHAVESARL